jgi:fructose/tagatose bisphosphate aldolase
LETAKEFNVPVMVQFSNGGAAFMGGKIAAGASMDFKPDPPAF